MPGLRAALAGAAAAVLVANSADATAPNCSNPVFVNRYFGAPVLPLVSGAPQPHPEGKDLPCQAFKNKDSCCTNETLAVINTVFQAGEVLLNATSTAIADNDYPQRLADLVTAQMNLVCTTVNQNVFPTLAADCKSATSTLTKYTRKLAQAAEDVAQAELKCARGLGDYFKGVLCFACEADWDQYLVNDAENVISALDINKATCTSIVHDCEPVNTAVSKVATTAVDFANEIITTLTGGQWPSLHISVDAIKDLPDTCGGTLGSPGDCESFYCDGIVSGMTMPAQTNWGGNMAALTGAGSDTVAPAQRRVLEVVAAATSSVNVYTATGYKAYSVGAADDPQGLQGWAIALIVIVVVAAVVGAVAGVLVVQRRRGASRSVQGRPTAAATYATGVAPAGGDYESFKAEQ